MIRNVLIAFAIAAFALGCASETTSEAAPEPTPAPEPVVEEPVAEPVVSRPEPAAVTVADDMPPRELPKTASPMPAVGLAGLAALGLGGLVRAARVRMLRRS